MTDDQLLEVLQAASAAVDHALVQLDDWGPAGTRPGQYYCDLAADVAAVEVLLEAGLGVLSEESGLHHPERELLVALDPVDGSTNAARGIPWFATSLCVLDREGPRVALVVNLATRERFEARRGGGARRDGRPLAPSTCTRMSDALVGVVSCPPRHLGWRQVRAMGAAALDLCAVAAGCLDAFIDCSPSGHAPWDYLGALLVLQEAGAQMVDGAGRDLVLREPGQRVPVAAATAELLAEAVAARAAQP